MQISYKLNRFTTFRIVLLRFALLYLYESFCYIRFATQARFNWFFSALSTGRIWAKNKFQQCDWSAKKFAAKKLNQFPLFY
jgi:hypothetical protein